ETGRSPRAKSDQVSAVDQHQNRQSARPHCPAIAPRSGRRGRPMIAPQKFRGRLFRKYVAIFVSIVAAALLVDGLFEVWFAYQASRDSLIRIQSEQASAAAFKIGDFVTGIQNELGWTTQLPWTKGIIEQRHFDALRLLRQVPAITELVELDANGREQLHVSRIAMDVIGSGKSYSHDPKFTVAL